MGPGDKEYVTLKALNTIAKCEIVFGWRKTIEQFVEFVKNKKIFEIRSEDMHNAIEIMVKYAAELDVALLLRGDPYVAEINLIKSIKEICRKYNVEYVVISGVSSLNLALAKIEIDIVNTIVISMHSSKDLDKELNNLKHFVNLGRYVVIYPKPDVKWIKELADKILKLLKCDARVFLLQKLSFGDENIKIVTLSELFSMNCLFDSYTILVIEPCLSGE